MNIIFTSIVVLAVIITLIVMLQSKGTGLSIIQDSADFGKFEKRGAELTLHRITIACVAVFSILCIALYFLR